MKTYQHHHLGVSQLSSENFRYLILASGKVLSQHKAELEQDERLKDIPQTWQEMVAAFETAPQQVKSDKTTSLSALDKQRDDDWSNLRGIAKLASKQRHPARKQAGQDILDIINSFGDVSKRSYSEQSAVMISLIKQLETRENRAKLATIGGTDYFTHLKESHDLFEAAYMKKMEGKAQGKAKTAKDLRRELETSYKTIYTYLLCLEYFDKDTYHKPLLAGLNDIRLSFAEKQKKKTSTDKKNERTENN